MRFNDHVSDPERQCIGKTTWQTKKLAKQHLRRLRNGMMDGKTAYRCPHCRGFHVGHAP